MNNKRILLISYYYPPLPTPRAIRWHYFSNYLAQKGYHIDVYRAEMKEFYASDQKYNTHLNKNITLKSKDIETLYITNDQHISSKIISLCKLLKKRILFGDVAEKWSRNVYRVINENLNLQDYDNIITVVYPYSTLLTGYLIKKKYGNNWIIDTGDPWIYFPKFGKGILKNKFIEIMQKKYIKEADKIIVTTDETKKYYAETYSEYKDKFFVVSQGYDSNLYKDKYVPNFIDSKKLNIVYTGTIYQNIRNGIEFLFAIQNIGKLKENLNILFIGSVSKKFEKYVNKFNIQENVRLIGSLPHKETAMVQKNADLLLFLGNRSRTQLPGKLFEYIGAGKPIFCIYYGDYDIGKKIIEEKSLGLTCINEREMIKSTLIKAINMWKSNSLNKLRKNINCSEYTWDHKAENFMKLLK